MSDILSRPYAERRVILIAPETPQEREQSSVNWRDVLNIGQVLFPVPWIAYQIYQAATSSDPVKGALIVPIRTAQLELSLPPGHPLMNHAYGGHPLSAPRYMPAAAFHHQLFEEKVNELMTLLASLGATRVRVSCCQGYRSAGGVNLGVAKGASGTVGVDASKTSRSAAIFEEHFRPSGPPKLPDGLIWFGHEPSWQAVADRRLKFNTSKFRAELRYEDSFGIDAKLKVGIEKLGIHLGGHFSDFESTVWEFEGEFA